MIPWLWERAYNRGLKGRYEQRPIPFIGCGCGAAIGEPCRGARGWTLGTHASRRYDFAQGMTGLRRAFKVLKVLGEAQAED